MGRTDTGSDLEWRIMNFLQRNFPQIQMHGGSASIEELDPETGAVTIKLTGACSGCGISPMTIQAVEHRLVQEIPEIEEVQADTGESGESNGMSPSFPGEIDDGSDTPF